VRRLIVSDIHSNLEALTAVLDEAAGEFDEVVCCGDIVGYNASPAEVIAWARSHADYVVRGNHDRACAGVVDDEEMNAYALAASQWTQETLQPADLNWLRHLPVGPVFGETFEVAHGSPVDEDDYLLSSQDVEHLEYDLARPICFVGHTHHQGGWSWQRGGLVPLSRPVLSERERVIDLDPDYLYMINPGSVGQPRDRDPRAAYAIWDSRDRLLSFRRVKYDIRGAQSRILEAGLPTLLAERLAFGR